MAAQFRLIFRGQIATGSDRQQAAGVLARRFGLNDDMTRRVMSGRKVALASGLDEPDAFALQAELENAGIITRIETDPHATSAQSPEPPQPAAEPPPAAMAAPAVAPMEADDAAAGMDPFAAAGFDVSRDDAPPCSRCQRPLAADARFCPGCGARRRNPRALLVVLVLIAVIVALLSVPLYRAVMEPLQARQQTREQVSHAMARAADVKAQVRAFIERTNFWPNSNLDAGLPRPLALGDETVASITVGNQALVSLTFREQLADIGGHTLVFVPASDSGALPRWECRGGTLPAAWLPSECAPPEPSAPTDTQGSTAVDEAAANLPPPNYLRRVLTEEFSQTAYIRDRMVSYYQRKGHWPERHEALELEDPLRLGSYAMRRVEVREGGHLLYEFSTALQGMEGEILVLQALEGGSRWRCESALPLSHLPVMCQP